MNKKKLSTLVTIVTAVALLAGCSSTGNEPKQGASSNPTQNNKQTEEVKQESPTKISIMTRLHTAEVPSDKLEKLIEEKTNTELDIQWVPDSTYNDKVNAAFATGALPMVFNGDLNTFRSAIRDDQFWEIGKYLKDFTNLSNLNENVLRNMQVDGKVYTLYAERPLARSGLIFRKDWADKLGLDAPTNLDELYDMLYQFTYNDPDGNNKNDTIGLTDRSDMIYGAFKTVSSWHGTPNYWGEKDGQLLPEFMFPQYIETMKFFKKLHQEGIINQDFPVTSKEDQRNLMITGKAGAYIGTMPDAVGLQTELEKVNAEATLDVFNRIEGPEGFKIWMATQGGAGFLFPKSAIKTEEDLLKILTFYDQLMSPEIANLITWGVEGEHYTLVDGRTKANEDQKMLDRELKPYSGAIAIGGSSTIPGLYQAKWEDPLKQKAEELVLDNVDFLIDNPVAPLESLTFNEIGARLQQMINDATFHFILGEIDEAGFQAVVDKWLADGGQKIIDEYTEAYNASN